MFIQSKRTKCASHGTDFKIRKNKKLFHKVIVVEHSEMISYIHTVYEGSLYK